MTVAPVDPHMALDAANASDLVQKKLSVDALKKRLGDGKDSDKKLREACEGFESIFLQKMWEQMRKNVKKEGYLHSKDEEAYQSMFDVELAKKMSSAGGIGLADMLQEQLGQRLNRTSRTTGHGALRAPLSIPTAQEQAQMTTEKAAGMTQDDLYSQAEEEAQTSDYDPAKTVMEQALSELASERRIMDPDHMPEGNFTPMTVAQAFAQSNPAPAPGVTAAQAAAQAATAPAQGDRPVFTVSPMPQRVSSPGKARPVSRKGASTRKTSNAQNRSYPARMNAYPGQNPAAPGATGATGATGEAGATGAIGAPGAGGAAGATGMSYAPPAQSPAYAPQAQRQAGPQALTSDGGVADGAAQIQTAPPVRLDRNV